MKLLNKSVFFIRTIIDNDRRSEKRKKSFNEQAMLQAIREECLEDLKGSEVGDNAVFLISNNHPAKWDFARLTQAIFDVVYRQRECLTLSRRMPHDVLRGNCEKRTRLLSSWYRADCFLHGGGGWVRTIWDRLSCTLQPVAAEQVLF
jgi:hypothetical protein